MACIASAVNGLITLSLRSTKTQTTRDDMQLAREISSKLEKVESIDSDDGASVYKCADKFLPAEKRAVDGRLARQWKKLRLGWSRKAPRNKLDVIVNSLP